LSVEFHLASSFVSLTFSWDGQCTKPVVRGGGLNKYQCAAADAVDRHRFSKPSCPARLIFPR
jgi:hypothetical protein